MDSTSVNARLEQVKIGGREHTPLENLVQDIRRSLDDDQIHASADIRLRATNAEEKLAIIALLEHIGKHGSAPIGRWVGALREPVPSRQAQFVLPVKATPAMEQTAEKYWRVHGFLRGNGPRTWAGLYHAMITQALLDQDAAVIFPKPEQGEEA